MLKLFAHTSEGIMLQIVFIILFLKFVAIILLCSYQYSGSSLICIQGFKFVQISEFVRISETL